MALSRVNRNVSEVEVFIFTSRGRNLRDLVRVTAR